MSFPKFCCYVQLFQYNYLINIYVIQMNEYRYFFVPFQHDTFNEVTKYVALIYSQYLHCEFCQNHHVPAFINH